MLRSVGIQLEIFFIISHVASFEKLIVILSSLDVSRSVYPARTTVSESHVLRVVPDLEAFSKALRLGMVAVSPCFTRFRLILLNFQLGSSHK